MFQLLATTATLYVMTRSNVRDGADVGIVLPPAAFPLFSAKPEHGDMKDPAWQIWKVLNPDANPLVHLRIEVPTIVAFRPDVDAEQTARYHIRPSSPILDLMFWSLKVLVLPMIVTLIPLYGLLLYLLKDVELLEAQRNRAGADASPVSTADTLNDHVSFSTLPRAFATDAELLATSSKGHVHLAVGLENELSIWRFNEKEPLCVNTSNILLRTPSTSSTRLTISALAVDSGGDYLALGTSAGVIHVGLIGGKGAKFYQPFVLPGNNSEVKELHFVPQPIIHTRGSGPNSRSTTPASARTPILVALYRNGTVASWKIDLIPAHTLIEPSKSSSCVTHSYFLGVRSSDRSLIAFSFEDGSLEITEIGDIHDASLVPTCLRVGNPFDRITKVDACHVQAGNGDHIVICVASEAGVISLWDATSSECLLVMEEPHVPIDQLRLAGIRTEVCHFCGEPPLDSFLIIFSVGCAVIVHRAYMTSPTRSCSCPGNAPRLATVLSSGTGRRSRSSSMASTTSTALTARRLSTVSDSSASDTSFPVSGHGVLSRRASEKESLRRPSECFSLPLFIEEQDEGHSHPVGPLDSTLLHPVVPSKVTVIRAGEATCERGGWDVVNGKVVGIRRISRSHSKAKADPSRPSPFTSQAWGLSEAALDRWECWTYEPTEALLRASTLTSLCRGPHRSSSAALPSHNANNLKVVDHPRLPFTRVVAFRTFGSTGMAGFGNTVGIFHFS